MGEMLGRSNLIDDIDLNALIVEDYIECNLPNGVESDSLVVCNASSSYFDGDHDDIPDGCNPSAGGGGTSTDANADDSSIPAVLQLIFTSSTCIFDTLSARLQVEERALQGQKMVFECDVEIVKFNILKCSLDYSTSSLAVANLSHYLTKFNHGVSHLPQDRSDLL
nr:hypothetical protein Iba_chr12dCG8100 [Ipomoea batatas]